jgi:hypothetical protein
MALSSTTICPSTSRKEFLQIDRVNTKVRKHEEIKNRDSTLSWLSLFRSSARVTLPLFGRLELDGDGHPAIPAPVHGLSCTLKEIFAARLSLGFLCVAFGGAGIGRTVFRSGVRTPLRWRLLKDDEDIVRNVELERPAQIDH